jgi:hypothetical protein
MALRSEENHVIKYRNLCGINAVMWTIFKDLRAKKQLPQLSSGFLVAKEAKKQFDFRKEHERLVEELDFAPSYVLKLWHAMQSSYTSVIQLLNPEQWNKGWEGKYKWILDEELIKTSLDLVNIHAKANVKFSIYTDGKAAWEELGTASSSAARAVLNLYFLQKSLPKGVIDIKDMLFRLSKIDAEKQIEADVLMMIDSTTRKSIDLNKLLEYIPDENKVRLIDSEMKKLGYGVVMGCVASLRTPPEYLEWFEANKSKFSKGITMPKVMLSEYLDYMIEAVDREFTEFEKYWEELPMLNLKDQPLFMEFGEIHSADGEQSVELKCPFH